MAEPAGEVASAAAVPHARSAALYDRARRVLPGGNTRTTVFVAPHPLYAREGRGARVIDVDGVSRIDFVNNYTALIHGHGHAATAAAVAEQLARGTCFAMPTEAEVALAELICQRLPSAERVRFTNSGTEAVMMAVKAARAYTGRPKIAKCEGAYHGSYDYVEASLAPGPGEWGEPDPTPIAYARGTPQGVLEDVVVVPFNDVAAAERILAPHAGDLAAIVLDPMPFRVGLIAATPAFLALVRAFARTHGILLILDEVISFRLGYRGAQGEFGVEPDLTTLGKIIGGGLPVGAVAGRAEVMAVFDPSGGRAALPHGGTFNANPLTMAAGRATMQAMTPQAYDRINALGAQARAALAEAFAAAGVPGQVSGRGSLFRVHFHDRPLTDYRAAHAQPEERARLARFYWGLVERGVMISADGLGAISTPMGGAEVEALAEAALGALRALPA
jgi:glutamate-1-semialdehyde 2,1-aminomutase